MNPLTHRNRPVAHLLMSAAAGVALLCAAPAAAGAHGQSHCKQLRGRNRVHSTTIRVVSRHVQKISRANGTRISGTDYLGCALPNGKVRKVGETESVYLYPDQGDAGREAVESDFGSFGQSAGDFLLVRTRASNLTGDYFEQSRKVLNVRTGASYSYFHSLQGGPPELAPPEILKLDPQGRLAGIFANNGSAYDGANDYSSPPAGTAQVIAFAATGTSRVLDTAPIPAIPAASLMFKGGIVSWTNAGTAKTASF